MRDPTRSAGYGTSVAKSTYKIYGASACLAAWDHRPEDVVKVYVHKKKMADFGPLLKSCAQARVAYKLIPEEEMVKVSGSQHHEGVCMLLEGRQEVTNEFQPWLRGLGDDALVLILDGVSNPHNIGAILRSAAHFGVSGVISEGEARSASGAIARIAEGGAEWVPLVWVPRLGQVLASLKNAGFSIYAADGKGENSLWEHEFTAKTAMILGAEREGIRNSLVSRSDGSLAITGTQRVESLNVSNAGAIVAAEYWRQRGSRVISQ